MAIKANFIREVFRAMKCEMYVHNKCIVPLQIIIGLFCLNILILASVMELLYLEHFS